jgi:hypothetical protein
MPIELFVQNEEKYNAQARTAVYSSWLTIFCVPAEKTHLKYFKTASSV